jgi:hypothetical protein
MEKKSTKTRYLIYLTVTVFVVIAIILFLRKRNINNTVDVIPVANTIPGLVLYYPFSGNAKDMSGNNINGDVQGATLTDDRFGKQNSAYFFDGIDDSILFDASNLPLGSSPRTISAWIMADSFPPPAPQLPQIGSRATIIGWGHDDVLQLSNMEIVNNKFTFHVFNYDVMGSTDVKLKKWYHLVIAYSGQKTTLYINGKAEEYDSNLLGTADLPGRIGAFPDQSVKGLFFPDGYDMSYFHGVIDDICIFPEALTTEQVLSLYHEGGWDSE